MTAVLDVLSVTRSGSDVQIRSVGEGELRPVIQLHRDPDVGWIVTVVVGDELLIEERGPLEFATQLLNGLPDQVRISADEKARHSVSVTGVTPTVLSTITDTYYDAYGERIGRLVDECLDGRFLSVRHTVVCDLCEATHEVDADEAHREGRTVYEHGAVWLDAHVDAGCEAAV